MTFTLAWPGHLLAFGSRLSCTPMARSVGRALAVGGGALLLLRLSGLG